MAALHHPVFLFNKDLGGKRCEPQMVTLSQHGISIVTVLLPQASVHALTLGLPAPEHTLLVDHDVKPREPVNVDMRVYV